MLTYISLFSSAGVGCYGFKKKGFECIATNELLERRINIQRYNNKCKYESGYICGDITTKEIQVKLKKEINKWKKEEQLSKVDVIMATPPCQGMSTANYKKGDEIDRNSLVVEAIHLIKEIKPRVFILENVRAFLTTMCIDKDEEKLGINECIEKHLSNIYNIYGKVVNFMEYGIPSSRPRTLVVGTLKDEINFSPLNIFPLKSKKVSLKEAIGDLNSLDYGECDANDYLHSFRVYPKYMQEWIHDLGEGETAFNNPASKIPYKIVDGKKQILKSGHMGNKFRRMIWDAPAPCITTRNDQLASQSTIHPTDDRVLSIRELMRVMSIPDDFKWVKSLTKVEIDENETLIRQSIGEAVPTGIIMQIAENIKVMLEYDEFIKNNKKRDDLTKYKNSTNYYIKSYVYENLLDDSNETGSFYTPQSVVYNTIKLYKPANKKISILEPSVGMGAFIPQLLRLVDDCDNVEIDCVDISNECIENLKLLVNSYSYKANIKFNYIQDDFLLHKFNKKYDVIVSNPPYYKMKSKIKNKYKGMFRENADNIFCLFMDKFEQLSDEILIVIPKIFLMIPDCNYLRELYSKKYNICSIYDYGVKYFSKVFIEIISIHFKINYNNEIKIVNFRENIDTYVKQKYIYHDKMWLLYRNAWFDEYIKTLKLNVFDFYRDRQLTNKYLSSNKKKIWVIRSKNLLEDGTIQHKENYDRYIDSLDGFVLKKYYNKNLMIFTNFTYNTRAAYLPKNCIINGSFCIMLPKINNLKIDIALYSTKEFRDYYSIVKNLSKFTLNIDSNSIYYIGVKK